MMSIDEIIEIVRQTTGISLLDVPIRANAEQTRARYLGILLMVEESHKQEPICKKLKIKRWTITVTLRTCGELLTTNREFKDIYKQAVSKIAAIEWAKEDMTFKLTQTQFEEIYNLFNVIMHQKPTDIPGSLMLELLTPIYNKMTTRVNASIYSKHGWNLTLTPMQAKSYYAFFKDMNLRDKWLLASMIIDKHLVEIDRVFTPKR